MKCPHCQKEINAGSLLGSVSSERKVVASKMNGKKGGRPKKGVASRLEHVKDMVDKMSMKIINQALDESFITKPWENIDMHNSVKFEISEKCASPGCPAKHTKLYHRSTGKFWLCDTHKP